MDKRGIKEFSIMARNELRSQVTRMANAFGVFEHRNGQVKSGNDYVIINGKTYPKVYETAYNKLLEVKQEKGFEELIEEVAYTWFNRFIALRFMEVNDYLPSHIRVLSSEIKGKVDPDILDHYEEADLDINFEEIYKLINVDKNSELAYRKLLIAQCNKLSSLMPFLFEKINDYTEMLLPDNLLIPESIISKLVGTISEDDFKEEVEIIGWIYQYYISEKKDKVFADLKKNIKISKENIPAATQLFTPKWIVKYMVENSLGRLWLEGHPNEELQKSWKYYLEEAEQEPEVQEELQKIREEHAKLTPEDIKVLDPCMGSGHILVYAFDVLYEIYKTVGYSSREIPKLILQKNLYGLDIDDRAAQLASFALVMKARQYNKRIFKQIEEEEIELNLCSIQESNGIEEQEINYFCSLETGLDNDKLRRDLQYLCTTFIDAKEYGSILDVEQVNFEDLKQRLSEIEKDDNLNFSDYRIALLDKVDNMIKQAEILVNKYDICVTNPPYMGNKGINNNLKELVQEKYNDYKMDLFSVFITRNIAFTKLNGKISLMTPYVWMFISAYEKLRMIINKEKNIESLIQLEPSSFEDATVPICTFVINNNSINYNGTYVRLSEFKGADVQEVKYLKSTTEEVNYKYIRNRMCFNSFPGKTISYWINKNVMDKYESNIKLEDFVEYSGAQNKTANNNLYMKKFWEVDLTSIGSKWVFASKGGSYRKWYGNIEDVIDWSDKAKVYYKSNKTSCIMPEKYLFREGICWTKFSSYPKIGFRYLDNTCLYETASPTIHCKDNLYYFLGLLNSNIGNELILATKQSVNCQIFDVVNIPIVYREDRIEEINCLVKLNVEIEKNDWNKYETSFNFKIDQLIECNTDSEITNIGTSLQKVMNKNENEFNILKSNEERLNNIYNDIYKLDTVINSDVLYKDITISNVNRELSIKCFISYAVGCMLGRYSLDAEGIIYAGGDFNDKWNFEDEKVRQIEKDDYGNVLSDTWVDATFMPDMDNAIPVTENEYFDDDIVARFVEFIKTVYGEDTLEENLDFIADTLVKRNSESSVERIRRYFVDEFYKDHCKTYQKKPIYWMIDSGKNKGFKALVYLHRYNKETLSNVRLNYLLELQGKYLNEQRQIERYLDSSSISTVEKKKRTKELQVLSQKQVEIIAFDKVLDELANKQIELDLDDGVVVNYGKLQQVLAKIK